MVVVKTPFRISFFGGATDYPKWYLENGGQVLAAAINKYCHISCMPRPDKAPLGYHLECGKTENVLRLQDIAHSAVREAITLTGVKNGLDIRRTLDLPTGAGLGSSSSFSVGLLQALCALKGETPSPAKLARLAIHLEQDLVRENVGSQDQVLAAYGGLNKVRFGTDGSIDVVSVKISSERLRALSDNLLLIFTGTTRRAEVVAKSKIDNLSNEAERLTEMAAFVDEGLSILQNDQTDLTTFGGLLHQSWVHKRMLSPLVTNNNIDAIYETALRAGAIGGKLLGAGGGGHILFFAPPERHTRIKHALTGLAHIPFEVSQQGSHIVTSAAVQTDRRSDRLAAQIGAAQ